MIHEAQHVISGAGDQRPEFLNIGLNSKVTSKSPSPEPEQVLAIMRAALRIDHQLLGLLARFMRLLIPSDALDLRIIKQLTVRSLPESSPPL